MSKDFEVLDCIEELDGSLTIQMNMSEEMQQLILNKGMEGVIMDEIQRMEDAEREKIARVVFEDMSLVLQGVFKQG